ncbi:MFS general substrate transporter [Ramaria rubella]|nr:MFS general substrate transporter [Ramaria rubella]
MTVQPLASEIIFPFVNQMILEIGVVKDPEDVGFYSGFIESIFSCMSFVAIMPASNLADHIGRKPVVLTGIFGLAVSVATFGMSKSFLAMVISRCLGGALGSTYACTRVMIGEITDKSNQSQAFQWFTIAYRAGQIIGLPLGGILAHPARNFSFFQGRFWYEYPFSLPCFVAAAFALFFVIVGYFTLEETLRKKKITINKPTYGTVTLPADESHESTTAPGITNPVKPSIRSVLTPSIISLMANNVAMCFASETLFSVFPLFAFTPITSGGLGMSEAAIGTQLGIRAILHISIMSLYAPMERKFGTTLRTYRWMMWIWPLTVVGAPLLNCLAKEVGEKTWQLNLALFIYFLFWTASCFCWTAISIMINDATPSGDALATVNGLAQMATILPQAIAPALVTTLFAFSIESGIAGGNLIWIVLFVFTCAGAVHAMTLQEPTSDWRDERETSEL